MRLYFSVTVTTTAYLTQPHSPATGYKKREMSENLKLKNNLKNQTETKINNHKTPN